MASMDMDKTYSAAAEASSRHPHDWGRAMAQAMADLASQVGAGADEDSYEMLFGRTLALHLAESEDGVLITLSWTPDQPDEAERDLDPDEPEPDLD
jgi:hypothetical protein